MDTEEFNDLKIQYAIYAAKGSLTMAAFALEMPRDELMEIVVRRPDLIEFIHDIRQETADDGQASIREAVDAEAPWALKYALRTLGANRGYGNQPVESMEMEVCNRESHLFSLNWRLAPEDPLIPVQKALAEMKGHVTQAAYALGKKRSELQKLIDASPALQMTLFQERETLVDIAESGLNKAVKERKPWALMFKLNTIRRNAGFGRPRKRRQGSRPGLAEPTVLETALPQVEKANDQEPSAAIEPQPILIDAPARANDGPPAPGIIADIAAKLTGEARPIANGFPNCARNAPCPCASGRKFKRCCGA